MNSKKVYRALNIIRKYIKHYLKKSYEEKLAAENEGTNFVIDESLFW